MDLETLREELARLSALTEGWAASGNIAQLERDLALEKLRRIYDMVAWGLPDWEADLREERVESVQAPVEIDLQEAFLLDPLPFEADAAPEAKLSSQAESGFAGGAVAEPQADSSGADSSVAKEPAVAPEAMPMTATSSEPVLPTGPAPMKEPAPVPRSGSMPEPDLKPEPEQESESTSASEPEPEPLIEPTFEPEQELEPTSVLVPESESISEPEPEPDPGKISDASLPTETESIDGTAAEVSADDPLFTTASGASASGPEPEPTPATVIGPSPVDPPFSAVQVPTEVGALASGPEPEQTSATAAGATPVDQPLSAVQAPTEAGAPASGPETTDAARGAASPQPIAATLFGPEEEIVRHRRKQRVIMSLYGGGEPDVPADNPTEPARAEPSVFETTARESRQTSDEPIRKGHARQTPGESHRPGPEDDTAHRNPTEASTAAGAVLGEVINHDVQTLSDTIAPPRDVASAIRRSEPVDDLRRAIPINDKFLMIRDLFAGDAAAYEQAIDRFEALGDLDECMIYIAEHFAWNPASDGAKLLMDLLERKFS